MRDVTASMLDLPKDLNSEKQGISYTLLGNLLARGEWKESNDLTDQLIMQVSGSNWWNGEFVKQFPQKDLHIIDALWLHHSNGRFGFSVQREIWQHYGSFRDCPSGVLQPGKSWTESVQLCRDWWKQFRGFATRIGWCENNLWWIGYPRDFTYDLSAPPGHLPGYCYSYGVGMLAGLNQDQTGWSGWSVLDRLA